MSQPILVPQVGQDLTEATIVELNVKLGDRVGKGDVVAVVESEKASFEVEAFVEGIVLKLYHEQGDVAEVLSPLMDVGEVGEGSVQSEDATKAPAAADVPGATKAPAQVSAPEPGREGRMAPRSSPLARRIAAERQIDIDILSGSGPSGAVVLRDVEAAQTERQAGRAPDNTGIYSGPLQIRTLQSGQGIPILFLHGFGSDLSSWRPLVAGIGLNSPMLALDLPGHGTALDRTAIGFNELVESVGQTLRAVDGGLHLVGHSLGAAIAVALTDRGDLDVRSLTLLAPAGLSESVDGAFVAGFLAAKSEMALRRWMERLVSDPVRLTPTLVRATLEPRKRGDLTGAQARIARAVFEGSTQLFSVRAALAVFAGPATIVLGSEDEILEPREVERHVPGHVALHRLPGVGHLPQVEAMQLVQTLIARTVRAAG